MRMMTMPIRFILIYYTAPGKGVRHGIDIWVQSAILIAIPKTIGFAARKDGK